MRARHILLTVILLIGLSQPSCDNRSSHTKITYAMPVTLAALPAYVALEKGMWDKEGLEVDAKMFSSGRLALDALLAKNAEVMSVSETPLVHSILKGSKIFIVTTVTEHQEVKLIVRTDHGISNPSDLRGKKIATLPGTNSDYFMYEFFKKNNISLKEVKITNLQPPDMVTALINGDIDAYFAWEPHIYYAQSKIPNQTKVFTPGDLYFGRHCVAMNQDYVKTHPEVVEKLIRGFEDAEKFIQEHPDESVAIGAKKMGVPTSILQALLKEYKPEVELDSSLLPILSKEGQWAQISDSTASGINFRNYIYIDGLRKVAPSSVTIQQ